MSDYWKKKMDELEREKKASSSSSSYWDRKMSELKNEKKTTVTTRSKKKDDDEDDIAPIRSTKKEDDDGIDFFQKSGLFDDGYQFGDVTKTILGSAGDAVMNAVKGVGGLVEGVTDLAGYGIAKVADWTGNDDYADIVRKSAQENTLDKMLKPAEDYLDRSSIFGRTSDAILQGVGQVGGIMLTGGIGSAAGLGTAGVTALTTGTMGLSGMGSGMGEAYQSGATDLQALKHGLNSGAADAVSELIFGGLGKGIKAVGFSKGLSSADDMLAKLIASKFKHQAAKNIVEFGIKAGAEGLEEVIAGVAQGYSKYHNYLKDQGMDLGDVLKDENLLEQFIVGSFTSGLAQAPSFIGSTVKGRDFITGLDRNEQAVVKKEVENRIAEEEKDGKKLTAKEKAKIEEQVQKDLEKGYISTDLIEEVVGGETYKAYKDSVDREDALFKEYEELGNTQNPTLAQQYRYSELDSRVKSIKDNNLRSQRKEQLDQLVAEQVKGSRLAESYNERIRRGQAFEAKLSNYDAKQQRVIQSAMKSGILNNTNRTHEFVDMVAKISADKGVLFDFTNNEKLKESGFAVDGKTVNGYVTKDGITVNIQSSKALNSIVGHEITHVLEGTDLYTELQNAILDYAKPKGEYLPRYNSMKELYKDVYKDLSAEDYDAKINAEITADLVGDYLFTDADFINNLSTNHRNVFQKIYDEVKYLLKVATAGSKEARELEKVKRAFEKAYRENGDTQSEDASETKYSIVEDPETIDFLENQEHIVTYKAMVLIDGKLYPPMASQSRVEEEYTDKKGNKKTRTVRKLKNPSILGKWQQADERPDLAEKSYNPKRGYSSFDLLKSNGKTVPAAYNPYEHTSNIVLNDQFEEAYNRPELVTVEYHIPVSELNSGYKAEYAKDAVGQHSWKSGPVAKDLKDPRQVYLTRWSKPVRIVPDSEVATKYKEILDGTGLSVPFNVVTPSLLSELEKAGVAIDYDGSPMYKSIKRRAAAKETKYSLSDSSGKQLSNEQQEYFKDSVVRDENGNLKVMYHGTSSGGFTVFDTYGSNYGLFGTGSYFTDSKNIGDSYTKKGKGKNPQVYEAYLNIKNPMDMDAAADPAEWAEAFPDADFPESGTNEQFYRAVEEFYADQWMSKWEVAEEIQAAIESGMGYDGITHIGGGRVNADGERHRVYIAFQPEQIKNVDNQKPTEDPDIRYSLSEDSDGNRLTEEQAEYFKKSKMRDDNGNLIPMYHGSKDGGFHVFDRRHSDDHTSFFFVDSNGVASSYSGTSETYAARSLKTADDFNRFFADIGTEEYEVREIDGKFHLYEDGDLAAVSGTAEETYEEFRDWSGLGYGDVNYKVYLNLENPLEVDAKGREWNEIQIPGEHLAKFNESVFGKTAPDGFASTATTRNFSEYANAQGYDGVIFKNILDVGGYGGKYQPHTVAIAFDSNQIKSVANQQPTPAADIRYSLSDSNGKKLSAKQFDYFKDSKVRDENGNLMVMYHGTPNGDFTVFRDGTYFTASKEYADRYQNPGASSIRTGKVASAPKTFEVYLDIKKPFDIADAEARSIYINDYIKGGNAVGINPYLSDAEYAKINAIDWTEGEDLREFLIDNGYDYDGLVLDEGGTGGYGDEVQSRGKSYVVFSPEQVKNTDNLQPTSDPDIRFSLSEAVEETKDLLAVHNLTSEQVLKSLELGGLPMPSIAVLKADSVHDEYGDVSLILPKNAIDPKANKANKVYGGDAWTPVYPRIEYKPSKAVEKKISDKYYGLAREIGYDAVRPLYNYVTDLERQLNNASGETAMLEKLYDDTDMMNLYLQDSGKGKINPIEKETVTKISPEEAKMNQFFIDALGEELISSVWIPKGVHPANHRKAFMEQNAAAIEETYKRYCMEEFGFTEEETENVLANTSQRDLLTFVRDAARYIQNNGVTVKTEIDSQATNEAIRAAAADGYKEWIDGLFKGVEEKTGIRNNQDYYTRTGNPRSWDALHWANTLENVVKVMKGQEETGTTSFSPYNSFASLAHKRYGSIEEVKADSGRLGKITQEEYEAMGDSFAQRFVAIANSIKDPAERNPFIAADNAAEAIVDAVRTQKSKAGILKYLQEWSNRATKQTVEDIVSLVNDIANMPTGYFEAKPQRAVGFDEVGVFVIPNDADVKLKQELLNRGYSIAEYDPNVEGDRQRVVNQFEEYKFSLSDVGAVPKRYGRYNVYGKDIALETAPAQEDIAPVADTAPAATVSETESVAPVAVAENATATEESSVAEDLFPDDPMAPLPEQDYEQLASLSDADAPPEIEAPYREEIEPEKVEDPFYDRDIDKVGNRKVKAYMYENPEVKPFFQEEAAAMLGELNSTIKGERFYSDEAFREGGYEAAWTGVKRLTSDDIAYLLDECHMSYADIEKGLNAIIEDHGAENIAAAKKIEFILNDRLLKGYTDFLTGVQIPPDQGYINLLAEKQINEYSKEAFDNLIARGDEFAPPAEEDDIAPVATPVVKETAAVSDRAYEAIRPEPPKKEAPAPADDDIGPVVYGDKLVRVDSNNGRPGEKQRKWVGTSTESEVVNRQVLPDDLDQDKIHYQPISNKVTLGKANAKLDGMGYDSSVNYFNSQFKNKSVSLEDVALGERLIQEAIKRGDTKTAGELIQNVAILGTELGQKVQALSMIQRMTPEGQLKMLQKTVERGKTKGDKAYDDVVITQEMIDKILKAYKPDGSYDQTYLDGVVEDVKKQIADQMKVTAMDKVNAWRYLSMLGNPKTHIRNLVSNVAMRGTVAVKNALARTIESVAPIENRTKTWEKPTEYINSYAQKAAAEMKEIISDGGKYSEDSSIKQKRDIFKNKILNGLYEFNSDMLTKEDWWFSKTAFTNALSEYLTANGIRTSEDIRNNPKLVEKARMYAAEQSQIATFRQYSWLANKINDIERHNAVTDIAVGAIMPFKKTPINIAKTGLNYSPLGFAKTLTYDISQVKKGNMEASELIDHLSQNITGSALTLIGYMLAGSGFLSGAGDDDKEGEYDYQLGQQAYAINIGGKSYSLSWLSPIAMPLLVGANAYEQLVEGKEWNGDVVIETLAQTLDPLSEMSFLSGLDSVLSSYDSGLQKFAGIGETMVQNYATQFVPTLSSQVATVLDDTKRSTKVGSDSDFKFVDQTINKLKYKIPFLRETLEPSTDIWGNNIKQTENVLARSFETFLAPYAVKKNTATAVDEEIKALFRETGEDSVIPGIPSNTVTYKDQKYKMSEKEFTAYKQTYGQTSFGLLEELFRTDTYRNADAGERADMVGKVYDYARDLAKQEFLAKKNVQYTNATSDGDAVYKEDAIRGAIEADMPVDEYTFSVKYPEKHAFLEQMGISYDTYINADEDTKKAYSWALENPDKYPMSKAVASDVVEYRRYASELYNIKADKDASGKSISGSRKEKVLDYINGLDIDYGAKLILFKNEYNSDDESNYEIIDYLNSRSDISYEEEVAILRELGFTVTDDGTIYWD